MKNAKIIKKRILVDKFKKVVQETLQVSDGSKLDWIYLDSPDSVVIAGLTKDNELVLVRQYRYNLKRFVYELPAGTLEEKDKDFHGAAKREFEEETGFTSDNLIYLGKYYVLPGETNRWVHIFLARDAKKISKPRLDSVIEKYFDISIQTKGFEEVAGQIGKKNVIVNGIESCFAIQLAKQFLDGLLVSKKN